MGIREGCSNPECCASTGICGSATFGSGELDKYGYWEFPCNECARAYEALYPGEYAWPRQRILWFDHKEYFVQDFLHLEMPDGTRTPVVPFSSSRAIGDYWGGPKYEDLKPDLSQKIPRVSFFESGQISGCKRVG